MQVQVVFTSGHTSESYVSEKGWREASIERCPSCQSPILRHGTYGRKVPDGTLIARFYCRPCKLTVSLLPHFLAAGYSETLAVQEAAVDAVERLPTFDEAARTLRPEIQLQGARRWLRRRLARFRLAALLVVTAFGVETQAPEIFRLRVTAPERLRHAPTPLGLAHRHLSCWQRDFVHQQPMGPDPPG